MKLGKFAVANLLCLTMMSATAQNYNNNDSQAQQDTSNNTGKLLQSVINWAALLGFEVDPEKVQSTPPIADVQLTSYANTSLLETLVYSTFFGSIPTTTPPITSSNSSSSSSGQQGVGLPFLPQSKTTETINAASNLTFKNYNGSSGSSSSSGSQVASISANPLVDQPPYQADPVSQAIFNILGTPDVSACSANTQNPQQNVSNSTNPIKSFQSSQPCSIAPTMFQSQLVENVVGVPPSPSAFYSIASNAAILPQLNSNSLIAPLNYSSDQLNFNTTPPSGGEASAGLSATTQAELAANFIRYASGSVSPTILPNQNTYQAVYNAAVNAGDSQPQMQAILSTYLTNLRIYAAQSSVGIGNLYYILSRRLPQQQNGSGQNGESGQQNSQALNEYNMATWRIFQVGGAAATGSSGSSSSGSGSGSTSSSGSSAQTQWIEKINSAGSATVQKEIAILLAEINYQLYLDRQIQERMLMTTSVSLLQGTKATQPSSDLSNQITAASTAMPQ
ncbi:type IV secretion protein IcmX [Legionella sp. km772]|uniref:type IV secretion protein IcmX n=1 Tax=Legionella sp. km772 TaxID=2498111 RepID=UPI000F8C39AA|nr:type IV secretion protein IcmX [Legionella sp. km772]RUR13662.1 type IV secretion protein IcmX [Legionella sp. km772]